jgi:hypothetical protein
MPKRRRINRSDDEIKTATFSISEDNATPSLTTIHTSPTLLADSEQVFNVSEWTVETNRISTSNSMFSSMVEPVPSTSFSESDDNLHILGPYHNSDYYDVVDVSDFQPPPEPEPHQSFESNKTESSKSSKVRLFLSLSLPD